MNEDTKYYVAAAVIGGQALFAVGYVAKGVLDVIKK